MFGKENNIRKLVFMDAPPNKGIYTCTWKAKDLLNKYGSPITNAQEDFSIEAPIPNIFSSRFSLGTLSMFYIY
jgi:hypothetical protein